jgi:uncharacterized protein YbaA (DUF1428 family)
MSFPSPTTSGSTTRKLAEKAAAIFKEYGALSVVECWGNDVPEGKVTSFPMAVKKEAHETVVFSWIAWPSKTVRDEGMKKAMEDERMKFDHSTHALRRQAHDLRRFRGAGLRVTIRRGRRRSPPPHPTAHRSAR